MERSAQGKDREARDHARSLPAFYRGRLTGIGTANPSAARRPQHPLTEVTAMTDRPPINYRDYLQLGTLLACQQCESAKRSQPAHDEMLFIIVHQTY